MGIRDSGENKKLASKLKHRTTDTTRLNSLSDGVFAIAITILVLTIHVPQPQELLHKSLAVALYQQWPNYFGFILSFILIGSVWVNHHTMVSYIKRTDHVLVLLNLLILMDVAFLPFPTFLLSLYTTHPYNQEIAVLIYSQDFRLEISKWIKKNQN